LSEITCQIFHISDGTDSNRTCFPADAVIILRLYLVKVFSCNHWYGKSHEIRGWICRSLMPVWLLRYVHWLC